jgi:hypothetical protein
MLHHRVNVVVSGVLVVEGDKGFFVGSFDGFFLVIGNRFCLHLIDVVVVENE